MVRMLTITIPVNIPDRFNDVDPDRLLAEMKLQAHLKGNQFHVDLIRTGLQRLLTEAVKRCLPCKGWEFDAIMAGEPIAVLEPEIFSDPSNL